MASMAASRIRKELAKLKKEPVPLCVAAPISENLFSWRATIAGAFNLEIKFTTEYPLKPPLMKFTTRVYHPNIDSSGGICLDIIKPLGMQGSAWSPTMTVSKVLISLVSLLTDPNPNSALNGEAAKLYIGNRQAYDAKVRDYVQRYAATSDS